MLAYSNVSRSAKVADAALRCSGVFEEVHGCMCQIQILHRGQNSVAVHLNFSNDLWFKNTSPGVTCISVCSLLMDQGCSAVLSALERLGESIKGTGRSLKIVTGWLERRVLRDERDKNPHLRSGHLCPPRCEERR